MVTPINPDKKRNWRSYTKDKFLTSLWTVNFTIEADQVQSFWDSFEHLLMSVIDLLVMVPFLNNHTLNSLKPSRTIKHKINLRKRLPKKLKTYPSNELCNCIKNLNVDDKHQFFISIYY